MAAIPSRLENSPPDQVTSDQSFAIQRMREIRLSRMLMLYIGSGLLFMLLPGTFLGVWNLISISTRHAALSVSPSWIQAHGHAQIFGWIGSFILGIGFYSIPKLRRTEPFALGLSSFCWTMWTLGVVLRWAANVYLWHWQVLVPLSAVLELIAFAFFFHAVSGHKPAKESSSKTGFDPWILVVIAGTIGFMAMLLANTAATIYLAFRGNTPAFSPDFDQRYLVLSAWGFMVPFVWGFSAKWLPIFLGLKNTRTRLLLFATATNAVGVIAALFGAFRSASVVLLVGTVMIGVALRLFEAKHQPPKTNGVHLSYPAFVRIAYVWLVIAATLGIWAANTESNGVWGASRHALTVGFIATMVFSVGQRVLPAFSGMRLLFSPRLMGLGLALLTIGCLLRVSSEVLAYQGYLVAAWNWLPVSAIIELSAVTIFAVNMFATFVRRPPAQESRLVQL